MSLLNSVISAVGGQRSAQGAGMAALLPAVIEYVNRYPGGLPALLEKLRTGGLGEAVASWLGSGPNQSVSGPQLRSALGDDAVDQLARDSGQDTDSVLGGLSALLPQLVSHLSPDGQAQDTPLETASLMGAVSGILGKL